MSPAGPPGRRPPWWPEDEPWPPERPPWQMWAGRRRHRGLGCLATVVLLLASLVVASQLVSAGAPPGSVLGRVLEVLLILATMAAAVVLGAALVRTVARWIARDSTVDRLIEAAGRVQEGDYSARVPVQGSPESRSIARAFNQMSARLETTDSQRRSFMADVSHELRTPLAVIQGQLEAIRDGVYPADQAHLGPALDQVAILERLVDDLRTLALSESGSLGLAREQVDVGALVGEVVAAFEPTARAGGVALGFDVAPGTARAWLDPARMGSVLRNLVANALRYTPPGGSVTVSVRGDSEWVELRVRDTGRGIDPALVPTVFERFSRSADSGGSGLGLAIARALVEAHGGTISAASTAGSGTAMTVRLPVGTG